MVKALDFLEQFKTEAVNQIADFIPWLAPAPSAYFVAEASLSLLEVPPLVAVTIAVTIEGLGITLIHTGTEFYRWNLKRMRKEFKAPVGLALSFVGVYLVATIGLTVVLKIVPDLSLYAPALFPLLALTGAAQLVLRAQHVQRMADKEEAYGKPPKDEGEGQKGQKSTAKRKRADALPEWLPMRPESKQQFVEFVRQGRVTIPDDATGYDLAPVVGSDRSGRAWLAAGRRVAGNGKGAEVTVPEGDL